MEIKQAKPGSVAAQKGLGLADKQIDTLKSRFLPYVSSLFSFLHSPCSSLPGTTPPQRLY